MPSPPTPPAGPTVKEWWPAVFVALVTAVVFSPSVGYGFVNFDDQEYVYDNPRVLAGLTPDGVWWALTTRHATNWHPLTWLSLELDTTLFGPSPAGYHRTNVLLHAAAAGLAYLALRRLTGSAGRSLAVALLFGVHPLRVESVTWVAERKDVLSTLLWVVTLLAYQRYVVAPSRGRMAAVAVAFGLGLAAKPMLVTLPAVLLLLDWWPLGRWQRAVDLWPLVREKWALFALAAASCGATLYAQSVGGAVKAFDQVPVPNRLAGVPVAYAVYLGMTAWPTELAVFYPIPPDPRPLWQPAAAGALILGVTAAAVGFGRRVPYLPVGWLWYLGTLLPVIGIVQVGGQAYADRYTYVPSLGLLVAVVWGADDLRRRLRVPDAVAVAVVGVAVAGCVWLTHQQQTVWSDSEALWTHALRVAPAGNTTGNNNMGADLMRRGRRPDALPYFREVARTARAGDPQGAIGYQKTALLALDQGLTAEAEAAAERAVAHPQATPEIRSTGWFVLGEIHRRAGRVEKAVECYRESIKASDEWTPRLNLGLLLAETGRPDEAFEQLTDAQKQGPNVPECNHALGQALSGRNEWHAAVPYLERAVKGRPESARYHSSLAAAFLETAQPDAARREAREAARLDPGWVEFTRQSAWTAATNPDAAARDGKRALRLASIALLGSDPDAYLLDTLAAAAAESERYDEAVRIAERAAQMAAQSGQGSLAESVRARVARYRAKQPYRNAGP